MVGTNLDWLHKDKDPNVRANGKTFDDCHTVAGLVGLREKRILCLVSQWVRAGFIRTMLLSVLEEMGYNVRGTTHRAIMCEDSIIKFALRSDTQQIEGYHNYVIVDFID